MVNLPIFIMLLGILVSVANLTASTWNYEPTEQTIETLDANTAVTFANPSGEKLAKKGDYEVAKRYVTIKAKRPSTGEIQNIKVLIRKPEGAGNGRPGVVFMHGAGYGTCDNSFGDMASDLSSAGFVTAVLDKPVWSTNDANRDYPGSAAIYDQARTLGHVSNLYHSIPMTELARDLCENSFADKLFFSNSGAEANEAAIKFSRRWASDQDINKTRIISFTNAFHGRTIGAMSLTASNSKYRRHYEGLMPSVYYAKYPDLYHSVVPMTDGKCPEFYMNQFKEMFDTIVDPYSVAGIMMEPEQGEGGYIVPPVEFVTFMRELCDKYGIMLIFDEVQCGNGRTGKLYCQEHFGVRPDIFSTAKGIGAGFPLGAVIGKKDVMEKWLPGAHGGTFGGNPVACAAGLASLKILLGGALDNAAKMGAYFKGQLLELQKKYPVIGDVRGLGLMLGIELVQNGKEPNADMTRRVIEASLAKGLMLINCGTYHNTIRFIPPCTVTKEEIDEAVTILDAAFKECMDKR